MRLLAAMLLLAPLLAFAQPVPPFHDLPVGDTAPQPSTEPVVASVATDGENFFAAWTDQRTTNADIYGARFTAAGDLLDPEGFPVHATYETESSPAAVWNGSDYAVFSSSTLLGAWNTLVSPSADVRGAPGERLGTQNAPGDAAWNGSRYAQTSVMWTGAGNRLEVVLRDERFEIVRRVTVDDGILEPGVFDARIATGGRGFLVVWEVLAARERIVRAAILDADGNLTTPAFQLALGAGADVAWNGTSYLATWAADGGVRAVTIAPDGTRGAEKLVAAGINVYWTAIAWDGHAHLVLWSGGDTTRGALVTASGDATETFALADRGGPRPAVASNGDVFFAVAAGETFVIQSTGATRVVRRGVLTNTYPPQTTPVLAAGATNVLTAWVEKGREIRINRRLANGQALDGRGVLVAVADPVQQLKVFAARGFYVVSWMTPNGEVRIARVTEGGEVVDPGGMVLADAGTAAVVAGAASETRVVWGRTSGGIPLIELVTATLPERGPVGTPSVVALPVPPVGRMRAMRLFPNGERFTLLYEVAIPGSRPFVIDYDYLSLAIEPNGVASAATTLVQRGLVVDAASDGRSIVFVFWNRDGVQARRLDLDGIPVDAPVTLTTQLAPYFARIERTATGFVVLMNAGTRAYVIHLDRDARPLAPPAVLLDGDFLSASDAAYIGGRTWIAYSAAWRPMPQAHGGQVVRSWLHVTGPRRRAAR